MSSILRHLVLAAGSMAAALTAPAASAQEVAAPEAHVDLRTAIGAKGAEVYMPSEGLTVPSGHMIGDNYFPYEGVGWENELIGYRLYLDERGVTDVFGKLMPRTVLSHVDYRSKYHALALWGMDVMHVGPSFGIGGLGLLRDGKAEHFGPGSTIRAQVDERRGRQARFTVVYSGFALEGSRDASVSATYSLAVGDPMTWVEVRASRNDLPLASGLVLHAGAHQFESAAAPSEWRYIASWGVQSENKDQLGLALFYRNDDAKPAGISNETRAIAFRGGQFRYGFLAVWEKGLMGIGDEAGFRAYLDKRLAELNGGG